MTTSARDVLVRLLVSAYPDLKRRLAGRLGSADLAGEALQDTYVRLQRAEISPELRNPRSYLFSMALNIGKNRARSEVRHLSAAEIETLTEIPDETPGPARISAARSEMAAIEQVIKDLPPRRLAMFRRYWIDDATYKEIAMEFNVSERTVQHEVLVATRYLHDATEKFFVEDL